MLAKMTFKNQITIPKKIVENFLGVEYFDVISKDDEIILKPVKIVGEKSALTKIRKKIAVLGLTEKDIDNAIHWARGKN